MATIRHLITLAIVFGLIGCTYKPKEKRLAKFKNNDGQILTSFYKMDGDTIDFMRLVSKSNRLLVQSGMIFVGEYGLMRQKLKTVANLTENPNTIDSLTTEFAGRGMLKKLFDDRDVMFIQILPDSDMGTLDEFGFMNLRQDIEEKIDNRLQMKKLGEWFAGDMGAGGNMLFFIDDWDNAMLNTLEVLREQDLVDHVLIAKRIMTNEDDWSYEIVYPLEFEGLFNEM